MKQPPAAPHRRGFLQAALAAAAATACGGAKTWGEGTTTSDQVAGLRVIDTNVSLFRWPFRRLPLDRPARLVEKLQTLQIQEAWAGSFEALLHRDLAGVNQRLVAVCAHHPMLRPVGAVNPSLPAWEDDLRRCLETHRMRAIRLYPSYHGYALDDPRCQRLLKLATAGDCLVQVVVGLEDPRTQYVGMQVPDVALDALPDWMAGQPGSRVQLLNARLRGPQLERLAEVPGLYLDTSRTEATDGVATLLDAFADDRVLLGTHAPFLIPEAALWRIDEAELAPVQREGILGRNASRLRTPKGRVATKPKADAAGPAPRPRLRSQTPRWFPAAEPLTDGPIWDAYFTPAHSHPGADGISGLAADIERSWPAIEKGRIAKLCYFPHVGIGTTSDPALERLLRSRPETILQPLQRWPNRLLGMIQLNANDVAASLDAIDRWLRDGPMVGVYLPGGGPGALTCTHPKVLPLVERVAEQRGVIMQHTWLKTGGKRGPGESTPAELATLARRYPGQAFVCAHAGGEWEQGIRSIREVPNISIETSGFDPTAGFLEMAVRELGPERILFGSHLPSRSLGTELGKVAGADLSAVARRRILGENFRDLLHPLLPSLKE